MFELGAAALPRGILIGSGDDPVRRTPVGVAPTTFLLLSDAIDAFDEDEEEVVVDEATTLGFYAAFLCPGCGPSSRAPPAARARNRLPGTP